MVLNTEMDHDPELTAASVIHHVVADLLFQQEFSHAEVPEIVDLAVIVSGLGVFQSGFSFVKQTGSYWDSTYWDAIPRPFLDSHALAYANAMAAWMRDDKDPAWANELPGDVKRPMRKSLKYLFNTNDSFFQPSMANQDLLKQSQHDWFQMALHASTSTQVVAIRHLEFDTKLGDAQEILLEEKLQSPIRSIVLHTISAVESLELASDSIANELRLLVSNRDDEIRAKAIVALAKLGCLDEMSIEKAAAMIDGGVKHVVFAGLFALSSLESVSDHVIKVTDRGLTRALQMCDYEFVGMFVAAFNRWLDDPKSHIERLLQDDQPDYLEIAVEALQNIQEPSEPSEV